MPKIEKMIDKQTSLFELVNELQELLNKHKNNLNMMELVGILESQKLSIFTEYWLKNNQIELHKG
jgi:uncharacterized protein YejL (UPF0352 family)